MNKKILLLSLISMFMISMSFGAIDYSTDTMWAGLVDWTTTTTALEDQVGSFDITNNGATIDTTNKYADLDGTSDYLEFGQVNLTQPYTMSFWVYADVGNSDRPILSRYESHTERFYFISSNADWDERLLMNGGGESMDIQGTTELDASKWYVFTVVNDGVDTYLYNNATLVGSNTDEIDIDFNANWKIGETDVLAKSPFDGKFSQMYFFNRALNATERVEHITSSANRSFNPYKENLLITTNLTNGEHFNTENISIQVNTSITSNAMFYYLNNTNYIVEDGLVAYYNFDGDYLDATANGNDGINSGSVLNQAELTGTITGATFNNTNSPPVGDYSMSFDGVNDYITAEDTDIIGEITLSYWINPSEVESLDQVVCKWDSYCTRFSGSKIEFMIGGNNLVSTDNVNENSWTHYTFTLNGTHQNIYINGTLDKTVSNTNSITQNANLVYMGRYQGGGKYLNGSLDDVRIYDRALTTDEIADIYANNSLANDVRQSNANRFNFEEGSGSTTAGQPIIPLDVQQVEFDGVNDYVDIPDNLISGDDNFTFSLWVKNLPNSINNPLIVNRDTGGVNGQILFKIGTDKKVDFALYNGAYQFNFNSISTITDNVWTHIAVVRNSTKGEIYINGVFDDSRTGAIKDIVALDFAIGSDQRDFDYFNGSMDEVRIYDRALTTTEIETLYNESPYTRICDDCNSSFVNLYDLKETNYNISFLAIANQTIATLEQNFNIDLTNPTINNSLPSEINSYFLDLNSYVNCDDENLKYCNITFQPDANTETSRKNFITYTEEFDNITWITLSGATVTPNVAISPDGSTTADRISTLSSTSTGKAQNILPSINLSGKSFKGSIYLKGEGVDIGKNIRIEAKRITGTFISKAIVHTLTNNWVRVELDNLTGLGDTEGLRFQITGASTNSASSTLVWGAQLELSTNGATEYQMNTDEARTSLNNNTWAFDSPYNFTYNGNQTYNIIAEDLAGNIVNKSGVILVNPYAYFNFQFEGSPIANYTFNNVSFEQEANFTIYGTNLNGLGSKSLVWSKFGYLTQTINSNIDNTSRINTTYNMSQAAINVNIYDKNNFSLITGINFSLEFVATVGTTTSTTTGTKTLTNLLFNNEQYTLIVSNGDYETEQAVFNFDNQENITLNVYMIESNASNIGYVQVKALNLIGQVISSAVVQALQWDSASSSYIKVSETQTSEDGIGNLNIILNDKYYIFSAYTTTENAVNSTPQIIGTVDNGKIIELTLSDATSEILGLMQGVYTNITEDYNETSLQSNVTFKWTNTYGGALTPCINVYRLNGVADKTLVSGSCATPSSSGTLLKSYTINSSYDYVIIGEYLLSSGGYLEMDSFVHYGQMHISNLIEDFGLQYYVLIVIFLVCLYIILEKSMLIGTTMLAGLTGISIFVIPSILSKSVLAFVMFICIAIVISIMRGDK